MGDVTYTVGGGGVSAWPVAVSGGNPSAQLNWNVEQTVNNAEAGPDALDGPVQVQAVFTGGAGGTSSAVRFALDRNQASAASEQAGPGSVNLLTGNLTVSASDVSVDSYGSDLSVSRSFNTRQAGKTDGANMFGPGWVSGVAVEEAGAPYTSLTRTVYSYDAAGRITTTADTVGGQCNTRAYEFTAAANRSKLTSYAPDVDGKCQTTSGTSRTWSYDTADRVTGAGYVYDNAGRTTTVPAADTANPALGDTTIAYHATDLVKSITQGTRTTAYALDVNGVRVRSWTDNATGTVVTRVNHYDNDGDSPSWTDEGNNNWSAVLNGLGGVAGTKSSTAGIDWTLANLHGDLIATVHDGDPGITTTHETDEYGKPRNTADVGKRYGWLGAAQRAADTASGIIVMGVRLYNQNIGRFLSVDPIYGGSCNAYDYACGDPVNHFDLDGRVVDGGGGGGGSAHACDYSTVHWKTLYTTAWNMRRWVTLYQPPKWFAWVSGIGAGKKVASALIKLGLTAARASGIAGVIGTAVGSLRKFEYQIRVRVKVKRRCSRNGGWVGNSGHWEYWYERERNLRTRSTWDLPWSDDPWVSTAGWIWIGSS